MIYFDYAATTPMSARALEVYVEASQQYYGNSSSLHDLGSEAQLLLTKCREKLATMINGAPEGVYFTSGGSESNYLAIRSLLKGNNKKGKHILTTKLEHASILNLLALLETEGYEVTYIPVNMYGEINLDELASYIREDTVLAIFQHVNSEIGTIFPIEAIGQLLDEHNVLFHCDCVQSFGKLALDVNKAKIDSLSISGHKIYGPKGVGICYINPASRWTPTIPNTTHENGFRPGTVNVPGIAACLQAADDMLSEMTAEHERLSSLRRLFVTTLERNENIIIEGSPTAVLPNIIGLRIKGVEGQYAMLECNRHGFAISTGSACSIGKQSPSEAMMATGKTEACAKEFIRISLGKQTKEEDILSIAALLHKLSAEKGGISIAYN